MKTLIYITVLLLGTLTATAQMQYSQRAHLAVGTYIDPGATFDTKDITGKTAYNGAFDFVYTNRYLNIRLSTERFPALDNYRDFMIAIGLNYEIGRWGDLQIIAAPRFGWVWRDVNGITGYRVNLGAEAGAVYWLTDRLAVATIADYTKRYDQSLEATPLLILSVKVGVRYKILMMR